MNNKPQSAAEFSLAAEPSSAISIAPINRVLSEQPVGDAVCLPELTAIDVNVVATKQASANDAQKVEPEQEPENYSPSDVGNAERFVFEWRETTRFDAGRGNWMIWNQTHWEPDDIGECRNRMVKVAKRILNVEVETYRLASRDPDDWYASQAKKTLKEGLRLHNLSALEAALKLASSSKELATRTSQFDMNPMALNCESGVIDLHTGEVSPHCPEDLHTQYTPVALAAPGTPCPRWTQFLNEIMCGDQELVDYLQRVVGYILTGRMDEQCFFLFYGCGSNGKSTFINTIKHLMGSYGRQVDFKTFMDMNRGDGPRNDLAMLVGKRFVVSPEGKEGVALDEPVVKQFTGGDPMTVRFLNKEFFEYQPVGKIVLATNHRPIVKGMDMGIWRRMRLVPFLASFDETMADPDLGNKLMAEMPAILRWAVDGAQLWQKQRLGIPTAVREATMSYRSAMDVFQTFIDDRCDVSATAKEGSQAMYDAYTNWCASAGIRLPLKQASFNQRLEERGFVRKKTAAQNLWLGVCLKPFAKGESFSAGGDLNFSL